MIRYKTIFNNNLFKQFQNYSFNSFNNYNSFSSQNQKSLQIDKELVKKTEPETATTINNITGQRNPSSSQRKTKIRLEIKEFCSDLFEKSDTISEEAIQQLVEKYSQFKEKEIREIVDYNRNKYFKKSYIYQKDNKKDNLTNYSKIRWNHNRYKTIELEEQQKIVKDTLKDLYNSEELHHFYNLSYTKFVEHSKNNKLLFGYYNGSMFRIAYGAFPDYPWIPNLFNRNMENIGKDYDYKQEIQLYAKINNINTAEDWYQVKMKDLKKFCKCRNHFTQSRLPLFIYRLYPDLNINLFKMDSFKAGTIKKLTDQEKEILFKQFSAHLVKMKGFQYLEQFYFMTIEEIKDCDGSFITSYFKRDKIKIFKALFPHFNWQEKYFRYNKGSRDNIGNLRNKKINELTTKFNIDNDDDDNDYGSTSLDNNNNNIN